MNINLFEITGFTGHGWDKSGINSNARDGLTLFILSLYKHVYKKGKN